MPAKYEKASKHTVTNIATFKYTINQHVEIRIGAQEASRICIGYAAMPSEYAS
jgi:hypothetical protein